MGELAGFSGIEVVKRLQRIGYVQTRQRGSHVRLRHPDSARHKPLTVPLHREIGIGLLRQIIKDAGVEPHEFLML